MVIQLKARFAAGRLDIIHSWLVYLDTLIVFEGTAVENLAKTALIGGVPNLSLYARRGVVGPDTLRGMGPSLAFM